MTLFIFMIPNLYWFGPKQEKGESEMDEFQQISYEVVMRHGCFSGVYGPVISRHRSLEAAVKKARSCDRWEVQRSHTRIWAPPVRGDAKLGHGCYGHGPKKGEPSVSSCVAEARAAERRLFA